MNFPRCPLVLFEVQYRCSEDKRSNLVSWRAVTRILQDREKAVNTPSQDQIFGITNFNLVNIMNTEGNFGFKFHAAIKIFRS